MGWGAQCADPCFPLRPHTSQVSGADRSGDKAHVWRQHLPRQIPPGALSPPPVTLPGSNRSERRATRGATPSRVVPAGQTGWGGAGGASGSAQSGWSRGEKGPGCSSRLWRPQGHRGRNRAWSHEGPAPRSPSRQLTTPTSFSQTSATEKNLLWANGRCQKTLNLGKGPAERTLHEAAARRTHA